MLKQALKLRAAQQLTMTPHLQQAIRLLLLPIADLHAEIQHALDENVMLEAEPPDVEVSARTGTAGGIPLRPLPTRPRTTIPWASGPKPPVRETHR